MSELTGNNPSEMLNLLLDRELIQSQEVELFTELASNEELRTEMKELLAIRDSVHNDDEAFVPPFAATMAVFSGTGFNIPTAGTAVAASTGTGSAILSFFKSAWLPALTAIAGAFLTYFILNSNYENKLSQLHNATPANINITRNIPDVPAVKPAPEIIVRKQYIPVISSSGSDVSDKTRTAATQEILLSANNDNTYNQTVRNSAVSKTIFKPGLNNIYSESNMNRIGLINPYQPLPVEIEGNSEYSLAVRGINGMVFPEVNTPSNDGSLLTNRSISFFFLSPYENLKFGIEVGQEPFSQSFTHSEYGNMILVNQKPNIYWAGIGVQKFFNITIEELLNAQPFSQLFLGGSQIGPMGKLLLGLNWSAPSMGLGAFFGIEGSFIAFQDQNRWFFSKKLGLTYGMSINF